MKKFFSRSFLITQILTSAYSPLKAETISKDYKPNEILLEVRDPEILEKLENKGYSFQELISQNSANANVSLSQLKSNSEAYKKLVMTIQDDLEEMTKKENENKKLPKAGVGVAFSRRVFDTRWFTSQFAKFELIGVINRIDRFAFDITTCGETRLIYRMSYTSKPQPGTGKVDYSRMPITVMLKYTNQIPGDTPQTDESFCADHFSKKWIYPENLSTNSELVNWLISNQGPLAEINAKILPEALEFNLQAMRIPSKARPDLAGHGTYLMRAFQFENFDLIKDGYLENTPDVEKIKKDPELKAQLLREFQDKIFMKTLNAGVLKLDNKYLASKAWSYSPYGIARKENRLFDQILSADEIAKFGKEYFEKIKSYVTSGDDYRAYTFYVRSPEAALMRLNDMSCVGCHQARAHAGFHFLGVDKLSTHPLNSILLEGSGHFVLELQRRYAFMKELTEKKKLINHRDFSFSPGVEYDEETLLPKAFKKAGRGHFCGLNNGPFSHWQCEDGLECKSLDEAQNQKFLGKCYSKTIYPGDPLDYGSITQDDHSSDRFVTSKMNRCDGSSSVFGFFERNGGFPAGQCFRRSCKGIDPQSKIEVCAESAGNGFNECVGKTGTGKVTFRDCLEQSLTHYGFAACDDQHACRNDFVCARSTQGRGYCTPSYFLFQVRVDGHIDPIRGY